MDARGLKINPKPVFFKKRKNFFEEPGIDQRLSSGDADGFYQGRLLNFGNLVVNLADGQASVPFRGEAARRVAIVAAKRADREAQKNLLLPGIGPLPLNGGVDFTNEGCFHSIPSRRTLWREAGRNRT